MARMNTISAKIGGSEQSPSRMSSRAADNSSRRPDANNNSEETKRIFGTGDASVENSDNEDNSEFIHAALSAWTQKAKCWFLEFTSSLMSRQQLPVM